jgi:hypothetical protein
MERLILGKSLFAASPSGQRITVICRSHSVWSFAALSRECSCICNAGDTPCEIIEVIPPRSLEDF